MEPEIDGEIERYLRGVMKALQLSEKSVASGFDFAHAQ